MIDYEKLLNPAQLEAVTTLDGPLLVVAGAGSGKTRTLVFRLARLVEAGAPPERVCLLTFTRKAAEEMVVRAQKLTGVSYKRVAGGTFHALAHLWLRRMAPRIGYPREFQILDRADSEAIIAGLMEEKGLKSRLMPKKRTLAEIFSRAVNRQTDLAELIARDWPQLVHAAEAIIDLERAYREYLKSAGLMDFDDLLIKLIELMESDERTRAEIGGRYSHLMIDEYQDTNPLQARLVRLLAVDHDNVMAVGDDSQSIYAFRGADFRNMIQFPNEFPGAKIIKLETNYRSSQPILDVANAVIAGAAQTFTKCLSAVKTGGEPPVFFEAADEADQSRFVIDKIQAWRGQGYRLEDIAVLFRSGYHSFDLEVKLNNAGIAFAKYGGLKFVEAAHIKDVLAFIRARLNPKDAFSLSRLLMLLPGVGPKKSKEIIDWLSAAGTPLSRLNDFPGKTKTSAKAIDELAELMTELERLEFQGPAAEVARVIEFYRPRLEAKYDDHPKRLRDLEQVADLATNYRSAYRFLSDLSLDPPTTLYSGQETDGRLVLSTVHSAKGLEWRAVILIWAVEGRFPAGPALDDEDALEEERRMMYVAVTRAAEKLYIISPRRSRSHYQGLQYHTPSRFLDEAMARLKPFRPAPAPLSRPDAAAASSGGNEEMVAGPAGGLSVGTAVEHPAFGEGRVAGYLGEKRIVVLFKDYGHKTLHTDYAPLTIKG